MNNKFKEQFSIHCRRIGLDIISLLNAENLIIKKRRAKGGISIDFMFRNFDCIYSKELPTICNKAIDSHLEIRKYNDYYLYFQKKHSKIKNNFDGFGFLNSENALNKVCKHLF